MGYHIQAASCNLRDHSKSLSVINTPPLSLLTVEVSFHIHGKWDFIPHRLPNLQWKLDTIPIGLTSSTCHFTSHSTLVRQSKVKPLPTVKVRHQIHGVSFICTIAFPLGITNLVIRLMTVTTLHTPPNTQTLTSLWTVTTTRGDPTRVAKPVSFKWEYSHWRARFSQVSVSWLSAGSPYKRTWLWRACGCTVVICRCELVTVTVTHLPVVCKLLP